jgi:hypothetical protein
MLKGLKVKEELNVAIFIFSFIQKEIALYIGVPFNQHTNRQSINAMTDND